MFQFVSKKGSRGWENIKKFFVVIFYLLVASVHIFGVSEAMESLFNNFPVAEQVQKKKSIQHDKA